MKKVGFIFMIILLSNASFGQIIKLQVGTTISELDWTIGDSPDLYDEFTYNFTAAIGVDYFQKKIFNLSSNVVFLRKSGKQELELRFRTPGPLDPPLPSSVVDRAYLDYVSLNTLFELNLLTEGKLKPFLSAGPRVDLLINQSDVFDDLEELDILNTINYGLLLGGGVKYDLSKWQFGLRMDYYLNFTKIAEWQISTDNEITDQTLAVNLSVGYKI